MGRRGLDKHYNLIASLVEGLEVKNAFEFGAGHSTTVILDTLKEGSLISCDTRSLERLALPERPNWTFKNMTSSEALDMLTDETFEFILHDGSHDRTIVKQDLERVLGRLKKNGIIAVHDTDEEWTHTAWKLESAVKETMSYIHHQMVTLPYGHGMTIVKLCEDLGAGTLELTWRK